MQTTLLALVYIFTVRIEAWFSPIVLSKAATKRGTSQSTTGPTGSALLATRRDLMLAGAGLLTSAGTACTAYAELDYNKVQDLLGADATATYELTPGKRPTYLTEPTSEFIENEQKAAAFKQANLKRKTEFLNAMEILTTAPNDESKLTAALDDMRRQVKKEGGLPIGITKEMIVKTCRRRKSLKYWPTNVEIAYVEVLSCF